MKAMNMRYLLSFVFSFSLFSLYANEKPSWKIPRKHHAYDFVKVIPVQDFYREFIQAIQKKNWKEAVKHGRKVLQEYPDSPFTAATLYHLGVAYFELGNYEMANDCFSRYLDHDLSSKHFYEVMDYKFLIGQGYFEGKKRHILGSNHMPQWLPAKEQAIYLFDEVIRAVPDGPHAVKAHFYKAKLQIALKQYQEGVETFQTLIRRFPKDPLAAESFLEIGNTYFRQMEIARPDPSLLELSRLNFEKFQTYFPSEPRLVTYEEIQMKMEEKLAEELFAIGAFYQKTKKDEAACMYYRNILSLYPGTKCAKQCKKQLKALSKEDSK